MKILTDLLIKKYLVDLNINESQALWIPNESIQLLERDPQTTFNLEQVLLLCLNQNHLNSEALNDLWKVFPLAWWINLTQNQITQLDTLEYIPLLLGSLQVTNNPINIVSSNEVQEKLYKRFVSHHILRLSLSYQSIGLPPLVTLSVMDEYNLHIKVNGIFPNIWVFNQEFITYQERKEGYGLSPGQSISTQIEGLEHTTNDESLGTSNDLDPDLDISHVDANLVLQSNPIDSELPNQSQSSNEVTKRTSNGEINILTLSDDINEFKEEDSDELPPHEINKETFHHPDNYLPPIEENHFHRQIRPKISLTATISSKYTSSNYVHHINPINDIQLTPTNSSSTSFLMKCIEQHKENILLHLPTLQCTNIQSDQLKLQYLLQDFFYEIESWIQFTSKHCNHLPLQKVIQLFLSTSMITNSLNASLAALPITSSTQPTINYQYVIQEKFLSFDFIFYIPHRDRLDLCFLLIISIIFPTYYPIPLMRETYLQLFFKYLTPNQLDTLFYLPNYIKTCLIHYLIFITKIEYETWKKTSTITLSIETTKIYFPTRPSSQGNSLGNIDSFTYQYSPNNHNPIFPENINYQTLPMPNTLSFQSYSTQPYIAYHILPFTPLEEEILPKLPLIITKFSVVPSFRRTQLRMKKQQQLNGEDKEPILSPHEIKYEDWIYFIVRHVIFLFNQMPSCPPLNKVCTTVLHQQYYNTLLPLLGIVQMSLVDLQISQQIGRVPTKPSKKEEDGKDKSYKNKYQIQRDHISYFLQNKITPFGAGLPHGCPEQLIWRQPGYVCSYRSHKTDEENRPEEIENNNEIIFSDELKEGHNNSNEAKQDPNQTFFITEDLNESEISIENNHFPEDSHGRRILLNQASKTTQSRPVSSSIIQYSPPSSPKLTSPSIKHTYSRLWSRENENTTKIIATSEVFPPEFRPHSSRANLSSPNQTSPSSKLLSIFPSDPKLNRTYSNKNSRPTSSNDIQSNLSRAPSRQRQFINTDSDPQIGLTLDEEAIPLSQATEEIDKLIQDKLISLNDNASVHSLSSVRSQVSVSLPSVQGVPPLNTQLSAVSGLSFTIHSQRNMDSDEDDTNHKLSQSKSEIAANEVSMNNNNQPEYVDVNSTVPYIPESYTQMDSIDKIIEPDEPIQAKEPLMKEADEVKHERKLEININAETISSLSPGKTPKSLPKVQGFSAEMFWDNTFLLAPQEAIKLYNHHIKSFYQFHTGVPIDKVADYWTSLEKPPVVILGDTQPTASPILASSQKSFTHQALDISDPNYFNDEISTDGKKVEIRKKESNILPQKYLGNTLQSNLGKKKLTSRSQLMKSTVSKLASTPLRQFDSSPEAMELMRSMGTLKNIKTLENHNNFLYSLQLNKNGQIVSKLNKKMKQSILSASAPLLTTTNRADDIVKERENTNEFFVTSVLNQNDEYEEEDHLSIHDDFHLTSPVADTRQELQYSKLYTTQGLEEFDQRPRSKSPLALAGQVGQHYYPVYAKTMYTIDQRGGSSSPRIYMNAKTTQKRNNKPLKKVMKGKVECVIAPTSVFENRSLASAPSYVFDPTPSDYYHLDSGPQEEKKVSSIQNNLLLLKKASTFYQEVIDDPEKIEDEYYQTQNEIEEMQTALEEAQEQRLLIDPKQELIIFDSNQSLENSGTSASSRPISPGQLPFPSDILDAVTNSRSQSNVSFSLSHSLLHSSFSNQIVHELREHLDVPVLSPTEIVENLMASSHNSFETLNSALEEENERDSFTHPLDAMTASRSLQTLEDEQSPFPTPKLKLKTIAENKPRTTSGSRSRNGSLMEINSSRKSSLQLQGTSFSLAGSTASLQNQQLTHVIPNAQIISPSPISLSPASSIVKPSFNRYMKDEDNPSRLSNIETDSDGSQSETSYSTDYVAENSAIYDAYHSQVLQSSLKNSAKLPPLQDASISNANPSIASHPQAQIHIQGPLRGVGANPSVYRKAGGTVGRRVWVGKNNYKAASSRLELNRSFKVTLPKLNNFDFFVASQAPSSISHDQTYTIN